jgi:SAM-dependent methyltransferase
MSDERLQRNRLGYWEVVGKPSQQDLENYYSSYYQRESGNYRKSYSELEISVIETRIIQRAAAIDSFREDRAKVGRILDIGCGEGFVIKFYRKIGWEATGIDFSTSGAEMINPDCVTFIEKGDVFRILNDKVKCGDRYDVLWLANVLEHVLDPADLLACLKRILLPGGILVVTVPNDCTSYQETLLRNGNVGDRYWVAIPDHLSYFDLHSLRRLADSVGWDCLTVHADFPIDWFLANDSSNYVVDRSKGPPAHRARLQIERLIGDSGADVANRFYQALAEVGFGRNLTAYLRPKSN